MIKNEKIQERHTRNFQKKKRKIQRSQQIKWFIMKQ